VLPSVGWGRLHAGALHQIETEPLVTGGIAQKRDSWSSYRVALSSSMTRRSWLR
jgi:hypothetical protein